MFMSGLGVSFGSRAPCLSDSDFDWFCSPVLVSVDGLDFGGLNSHFAQPIILPVVVLLLGSVRTALKTRASGWRIWDCTERIHWWVGVSRRIKWEVGWMVVVVLL